LSLAWQVANLKANLALGYAQLAACSGSEVASPSPEYVYDKQSKMSSLTYNCNINSLCDNDYLNHWVDHQHIRSDNVAINNNEEGMEDEAGSWRNFGMWDMHGGIHHISTSQEIDVFQDVERLSKRTRPNNRQDGHLEDFVLALLRRNR